ncbi:hypothetical protein SAMN04487785_105196 [Dyella jiangningensis]|uniref:hypothetical protein n=1 Tax=Dyella sp. AtDHG13 TaxID=1938897 RepID=UPI00089133EF|nr:hypothetical protein [Dyella sp. AtDHG13]PXV58244.1 hypothetical protein BDW41_106123 [Dyella sp. AtDHG13]SDK10458.1 hypothetical protein SAMN04487785_105196 [Dyella jiangningensis]
MPRGSCHEFVIGRLLIRLSTGELAVPGANGWVGTWAIYRLPRVVEEMPLRYGDTDIVESEDLALGMARQIARLVAKAL